MATPSSENGRVVCVFCGSSPGKSPAHIAAARALAESFHRENVTLVYGGGTRGIMGELAKRLVELSGPKSVRGVIPTALVKVEEGYQKKNNGIESESSGQENGQAIAPGKSAERIVSPSEQAKTDEYGTTTLVPDMHTRKRIMAEQVINGGPGSGFVVLPGGFGTLEEAMEMITWNQLGIHDRGIVLLNLNGYYNGIFEWVLQSVQEGFVAEANKHILVECEKPEEVLGALDTYKLSEGRYKLDWTPKHG